ncbi:MAG TPA: hypothetical protein PLP58_23405, partial [Prosthecobacter sp.]|nr:hypothetical protein [Prosthecobacter sp.]
TGASLEEKVRRAMQLAYARPARAEDLENARDFLTAADAALASTESDPAAREAKAWELLCQAWMMTNEFIHIR